MNNTNNKNIDALDLSLVTTGLFIVALLITMLIIYDEKQRRLNRQRLFTNNQVQKLNLDTRWAIAILSLIYLYINYVFVKEARENGAQGNLLNLQILASILALSAAAIALYVTNQSITSNTANVVQVENPEL